MVVDALDDALTGRVFADRYRVEDRIGDGAMGVVYRARHVKLARSFAIKVLHPQLLANAKVLRRFEREAQLASTLHHVNVIGVVDVGETAEGVRYLVMDLAEGETLSALIADGPMPAAGVIRFEMLTGRMPFDGDGVDVARANLMFDPPAMRALVPHVDIDPLLEAFTRRLMARALDDRIASAREARELLELIARDRAAAV